MSRSCEPTRKRKSRDSPKTIRKAKKIVLTKSPSATREEYRGITEPSTSATQSQSSRKIPAGVEESGSAQKDALATGFISGPRFTYRDPLEVNLGSSLFDSVCKHYPTVVLRRIREPLIKQERERDICSSVTVSEVDNPGIPEPEMTNPAESEIYESSAEVVHFKSHSKLELDVFTSESETRSKIPMEPEVDNPVTTELEMTHSAESEIYQPSPSYDTEVVRTESISKSGLDISASQPRMTSVTYPQVEADSSSNSELKLNSSVCAASKLKVCTTADPFKLKTINSESDSKSIKVTPILFEPKGEPATILNLQQDKFSASKPFCVDYKSKETVYPTTSQAVSLANSHASLKSEIDSSASNESTAVVCSSGVKPPEKMEVVCSVFSETANSALCSDLSQDSFSLAQHAGGEISLESKKPSISPLMPGIEPELQQKSAPIDKNAAETVSLISRLLTTTDNVSLITADRMVASPECKAEAPMFEPPTLETTESNSPHMLQLGNHSSQTVPEIPQPANIKSTTTVVAHLSLPESGICSSPDVLKQNVLLFSPQKVQVPSTSINLESALPALAHLLNQDALCVSDNCKQKLRVSLSSSTDMTDKPLPCSKEFEKCLKETEADLSVELEETAKDDECSCDEAMDISDLMTSDFPYYTITGCVPAHILNEREITTDKLEIPSWRHKIFTSCYSMEGTENLSDDVFEKRHARLEQEEKRRKRWDVQRIREQRQLDHLRENERKRNWLAKTDDDTDKERSRPCSLYPTISAVTRISISESLPVNALGVVLKKIEPREFSLPWKDGNTSCGFSYDKDAYPQRSRRK